MPSTVTIRGCRCSFQGGMQRGAAGVNGSVSLGAGREGNAGVQGTGLGKSRSLGGFERTRIGGGTGAFFCRINRKCSNGADEGVRPFESARGLVHSRTLRGFVVLRSFDLEALSRVRIVC